MVTWIVFVFNQFLNFNIQLKPISPSSAALHHSQLPMEVYNNCSLYPDNWEFAQTALSEIFDKINGIVGDVILKLKPQPKEGISVFQSYGMAVEDVTVAQMILEKLKKTNN